MTTANNPTEFPQPTGDSDLENPEWIRVLDISPVANSDKHDMGSRNPAVRTLSGALDFLHGLEHEVFDFVQHEMDAGRVGPDEVPEWFRKNIPFHPNKVRVTADVEASEDVTFQTFTLTAPVTGQNYQQILRPRQDRFRALITNYGPGIVYISHDNQQTSQISAADAETAQIPVGASREIRSRATVYAYPASGQAPVIDVQDEFGYRA